MPSITRTTFGQLPALAIRAADGAEAIVTLYGAHLVSWTTADGRQRLFCSRRSARDGSRAIRGGVPLIFPQFGERGDGMRHGFARVSTWAAGASGPHDEDGMAWADFTLDAAGLAPKLAAAWPFAFRLRLRVALAGAGLRLRFTVHNDGPTAFPFATALHSYLAVGALADSTVEGLRQRPYSEENDGTGTQQETLLRVPDKLDRIYFGVTAPLTLRDGGSTVRLAQQGYTDAVVWNPGRADAAALSDLADDEYQRFLCIEAALIEPLSLAPGASWRGAHDIVASADGVSAIP